MVITAASGVPDNLANRARALIDGDLNRLSDNAVEIAFSGEVPSDLLAGTPVDVNIVPADNRRKKLLIADMDSTMIPVECIDELADFAGVKDHVSEITERAMRGELGFEASLRKRINLLKNLSESVLEQCYEDRISLNPGARTLVQTMNKLGAMTALVSGGFTYFTQRVAAEAGFQMNQANILLMQNAKLTGLVAEPILGQQAKLETMTALCNKGGFTATDVLAVGDGANDAAMVGAAGLGVAYRAKPVLAEIATARLYHSDLTALLALQGIPEAEYA
ncbi:MAG: phosphoserine phosphatase SerB [Alphaproteobacteria bacterium]